MNVEKLFRWARSIGGALLVTLMAGCGSGGAGTEETTGGTISLPLTGTGPTGAQYRLTNATFDISGPQSSTVTSDPAQPVLNVDVDVGAYTVTLVGGWVVQRFTGGVWQDQAAVLTSNPIVALTVAQGAVSQATYNFGVGNDAIAIGKGRISIGAAFDDDLAPSEVTLAATDRGWRTHLGGHAFLNQNTITGETSGSAFRSYFTFDVSTAPVGVVGATLRLEIENVISPDIETLTIRDVSTSAGALDADDGGSPAGVAIYDDLGSGSTYGAFAVSAANIGSILDIPLSSAAVADLNAATTTFSVGLSLDVVELGQWVRFSISSEARVHELVLQYPPF